MQISLLKLKTIIRDQRKLICRKISTRAPFMKYHLQPEVISHLEPEMGKWVTRVGALDSESLRVQGILEAP